MKGMIMKTYDLNLLLEKKYCAPSYAYLPEVRSHTGFTKTTRTADALAMSLWPTRGLDLIGFELKTSRSDWLCELKTPCKADEIAQYCDFWYLVAGDESVVIKDEIPKTWGLLVVQKGKLREVKEAERLPSVPLTKQFLAAILRKATSFVMPDEYVKSKIDQARIEERESCEQRHKLELKSEQASHEITKQSVRDFEQASGVKIVNWQGERIGKAVYTVLHTDLLENIKKQLQKQHDAAIAQAEVYKRNIASLEQP